jgi:polysaccharide biosynthesis protein PslG
VARVPPHRGAVMPRGALIGRRMAGPGRALAAALTVAALLLPTSGSAAASDTGHVFGSVNLAFRNYVHPADAARMARGGIRSMRLSFDWFGVEGTKGTYQWGKLDRVVGNLASQGVTTLPVLFGTPRWAVKDLPANPFPASARGAAVTPFNAPPSGNATAYPPVLTPEATAGWNAFLAAAAARYGPGGSYWSGTYPQRWPGAAPRPIETWQIWNEPNIPLAFWPAVNVERYGKLVRMSARAIRGVDPNARIALAGLPGRVDYRGVKFVNMLFRRMPHISRYFDLVAFHPYAPTLKASLGQLENLRRVLRRHGDGRVPLWVSEIGWGSGDPRKNHFNEGPGGQARMLTRAFAKLDRNRKQLRLRRVSWFDWQDPHRNDPNCGWCGRAGLIDYRGHRKPAWDAFRHFVGHPR